MMRWWLILLMLVPAAAVAQPAAMAGRWALTAAGHRVMLLTLTRDGAGWRARMRTLQGDIDAAQATHLHGPPRDTAMTVSAQTADTLTLRVVGDPAHSPAFVFHLLATDVAQWRRRDDAGTAQTGGDSGAVFVLRRVAADAALATALSPTRAYMIDAPWPDEPAMTALFDADQAAREVKQIDWKRVWPEDTQRRAATQALLDAGRLHSGTDFYRAAFVFQHGSTPAEYLKAHALAVIATARGRRDAAWIAAATFDRYLQSIGQPQAYGTQYHWQDKQPATQEPYDRTLLSDAMRQATGVPTLAQQERRRAGYDEGRVP